MKTTRAMLVIGVLMLVLAVIVAQGLRPEEAATVSGPVISGAVSRTPETPHDASSPQGSASVSGQTSGGVLVPLDAGTLKMDSTTPASSIAPVSPTELTVRGISAVEAEKNSTPVAAPSSPAEPQSAPSTDDKKTDNQKRAATATTASAASGESPKQPDKLVVTTTAPKNLVAGQKAISRTRLEISPRSASFRLTGVSALKGKAFALKEPDRIVVDLEGSWGINLARTPANTLIKSVRAGIPDSSTRLVLDLHKAPKSFKLVQVDAKTLELQIR